MTCKRCGRGLTLHEDGKTWMDSTLHVTCPTGGPHSPEKTFDWDTWENTLDNWKRDVL